MMKKKAIVILLILMMAITCLATTKYDTIQFRRDTATNFTTANPVLAQGEPGFEYDTGKMKIGDGLTHWNSLAYFAGSGGSGTTDVLAVHVSTANEIHGVTAKGTPVWNDVLLIEDSAATWAKKRITIASLPYVPATTGTAVQKADGSGGVSGATYADVVSLWTTCTGYLKNDGTCATGSATDSLAFHTTTSGEIAGRTSKGTPVANDLLLIEDSADTNAKKKITIGSLKKMDSGEQSITGSSHTYAVDWSLGATAYTTLNDTGATVTFANPVGGNVYRLAITQGSGGSKTITTWPTITWMGGGVAPTLSTTAGYTDIITCLYTASTFYCQCLNN